MARWRSLAITFVLALAIGAVGAAPQVDGLQGTFTCGQDESLAGPIQVSWTSIVLAGDGRLYSPCPGGSHGREHREIREAILIGTARYSADFELRRWAAQAEARNATRAALFSDMWGRIPPAPGTIESLPVDGLGGLVNNVVAIPACYAEAQLFDGPTNLLRWQPGLLFRMLQEVRGWASIGATPTQLQRGAPVAVAREAAYGIGVLLSRPGLDANIVTAATKELRGCYVALNLSGGGDTAGLMLEDLGLARYEKEADIDDVENFLVRESQSGGAKTLGAVKGLEALLRRHSQHRIGEAARARLRQLVIYGNRTLETLPLDTDARIRRLAMMALQAARDLDASILGLAAIDRDWQVRRLVASGLDLADPQMADMARRLADDPAFQVRYELLSPLARRARQTGDCAPIVERFNDPSPTVALRAMDLLPATCTDLAEILKPLISLADRLESPSEDVSWHFNSHALTALVRVAQAEGRPRLAIAAKHDVWQVRAAAAANSVVLRDENIALMLARDPEPNVQTAALDALSRLRSAAVVPAAIDALKTASDYQLIRMAATVLKGLPEDSRDAASTALFIALRRLTDQASDTAHDPSVAILDRLSETLSPGRATDLLPFMAGLDSAVNAAAIALFTRLTGDIPHVGRPRKRYPYQPTPEALNALPSQAVIQLADGVVTLTMLKDVAPVTIARFTELAKRGYYNGLTFHRVVPNFVAQGGSPGANEYMGTSRYMRDEVGPQGVHVRGAVGISTRGGDTGDGQIFIDLVDLPRLDRDYTVFAYVTQGMELVDRMLEGAKIVGISVK
jgi:cyclophilin family peptidyl-prolyl cis-trans isomerase